MKIYCIAFLLMMFGCIHNSNAMDIKGHIDSINEKNIIIRFDGNSFGLVGDVAKVTFIEVDGNERVIGKWQIESNQGRLALAKPLEVLEAPGVGQSVVIYVTGPRVKKPQPGGGFVPDLLGKKLIAAKKKLADIGFKVKTKAGQSAPSPEQEFTVSAMEPASGTQLAKGSEVTLTSFVKHQQLISVPDVVGLTGTKAEKHFTKVGLKAEIKITKPAPAKDKTFVTIRTEPAAGSDVAKGSKVIVVTYGSYKPIKVAVPSLVGKQVNEAETALTKLGLKSNKLLSDKNTPAKQSSNTILSQEPEAGVKVNKGDIVELVHYGVYESSAILPDLLGEKISNAKSKLIGMGFKVKTQAGQPAPDKDREFTVSKMKPAPGTRFDKGKEVVLTSFVKYRQQVSMPKVVGLNEQKAKEKLTGIGLKTKVVFGNPAPTKNDSLTVAKTTPPVGSTVHQGDTVTLVVYPQFIDKRTVPEFNGLTEQEVIGQIKDAGLNPQKRNTVKSSSPEQTGKVSSLDPPPGTELAPGETIFVDVFGPYSKAVNPTKKSEHCSLGKSGFIYNPDIDYFVFRSREFSKYSIRSYKIVPIYNEKHLQYARKVQAEDTMDLVSKGLLKDFCPHLKENCQTMNHADGSFFKDLCGKWDEPVPSSSGTRSVEKQETSPAGKVIFSDSADSFGGGQAVNTKKNVSGENCESYNQCLTEMMQQIQQLSLKMASGQSSTLGCQYLGLGQAMVRVSKDANSAGCPIAGNYEQAGDMMKEVALQMCGGQAIPFDITTLPGCSQLGKKISRKGVKTWKTSYGDMTFSGALSGNVRATYKSDGGRVFGTIKGNILNGYWVENGSAHKCKSAKDGSYYWGRVIYTFNNGFSSFKGLWGYCDETPTGKWDGERK